MKIFIILLTVLTITACGSQSSLPQPSVKLQNEDLTESLAGIDSNGDGVRDDIESYLKIRFSDKPQVLVAAMKVAQAESEIFGVTDRNGAMESGMSGMQAEGCLSNLFTESDDSWMTITSDLVAFTFNTEKRLLKYKEVWKLRGGGTFSFEPSLCSQ